jgi:hypothetical protein
VDTLAAVGRDGTLRVISLAEGAELLRYDADNALVDLAAAGDRGFWAVEVSGRLIPPRPAAARLSGLVRMSRAPCLEEHDA